MVDRRSDPRGVGEGQGPAAPVRRGLARAGDLTARSQALQELQTSLHHKLPIKIFFMVRDIGNGSGAVCDSSGSSAGTVGAGATLSPASLRNCSIGTMPSDFRPALMTTTSGRISTTTPVTTPANTSVIQCTPRTSLDTEAMRAVTTTAGTSVTT